MCRTDDVKIDQDTVYRTDDVNADVRIVLETGRQRRDPMSTDLHSNQGHHSNDRKKDVSIHGGHSNRKLRGNQENRKTDTKSEEGSSIDGGSEFQEQSGRMDRAYNSTSKPDVNPDVPKPATKTKRDENNDSADKADSQSNRRYEDSGSQSAKRCENTDGQSARRYENTDGQSARRYENTDGQSARRYENTDSQSARRYKYTDNQSERFNNGGSQSARRYENTDSQSVRRYENTNGQSARRYKYTDSQSERFNNGGSQSTRIYENTYDQSERRYKNTGNQSERRYKITTSKRHPRRCYSDRYNSLNFKETNGNRFIRSEQSTEEKYEGRNSAIQSEGIKRSLGEKEVRDGETVESNDEQLEKQVEVDKKADRHKERTERHEERQNVEVRRKTESLKDAPIEQWMVDKTDVPRDDVEAHKRTDPPKGQDNVEVHRTNAPQERQIVEVHRKRDAPKEREIVEAHKRVDVPKEQDSVQVHRKTDALKEREIGEAGKVVRHKDQDILMRSSEEDRRRFDTCRRQTDSQSGESSDITSLVQDVRLKDGGLNTGLNGKQNHWGSRARDDTKNKRSEDWNRSQLNGRTRTDSWNERWQSDGYSRPGRCARVKVHSQ